MNDPYREFGAPEAVVEDPNLTAAEKIGILKRWEYDERGLAVAEEEGMPNGAPSILGGILRALDRLTGGLDLEHSPPTKQGGA